MSYLTYVSVGVILIASIISIIQMLVGRFQPPATLIRGLGACIIIWGIALWAKAGFPLMDGAMFWLTTGVAISKSPRIYRNYRLIVNKECYLQNGKRVQV